MATATDNLNPALSQAEATAAAERADLVRQLRTQEGLRERAGIGMHEAATEAAAARQAESTLQVDVQVWRGSVPLHLNAWMWGGDSYALTSRSFCMFMT